MRIKRVKGWAVSTKSGTCWPMTDESFGSSDRARQEAERALRNLERGDGTVVRTIGFRYVS